MKRYDIHIAKIKLNEDKNNSDLLITGIYTLVHFPILRVIKDVKDTLKPYKTTWQAWRDLCIQPLYGIGNILGAALTFLFTLGTFLLNPIANFKINGLRCIGAAFTLALGVFQIISWPFTLLRMPLRGLITLIKGTPKIEDSKGLRELVTKYEKASNDPNTQKYLAKAFLIKIDKHIARKQKTGISKEELNQARNEIKQNNKLPPNVITLFKSAFEKRDKEIIANLAAKRPLYT